MLTRNSSLLIALTFIAANGCGDERLSVDLAELSQGTALLSQINNVRLGMTANEVRASRRVTDKPYSGLSEIHGDTTITYFFPLVTTRPVDGTARLSGVAAAVTAPSVDAAKLHYDSVVKKLISRGLEARCFAGAPAPADSSEGAEFRASGQLLRVVLARRLDSSGAVRQVAVVESLGSDSTPLRTAPCP